MGERTRLRLVFLPSVARDGAGERATASPQERHLSAGWREELSGSLEPATPTTPKETTAPWNGSGEYPRPRGLSSAPYKLLVLGDAGVGKSAIVTRYVADKYQPDREATVGVRTSTKTGVQLEEGVFNVQITELSAERSFQGLADAFYKDAHGCVVVFDLGQRRSLRGALRWKRHIDRLCSLPDEQRFPSLLLANKCDVTGGRDVTQWEVEDVVKQADFLTWIEVSAKYNFMVNEAIGYLLRVVLSRAGPPGVDSSVHLTDPDDEPPPSRSCCGAGAGSQTRSRSNESLQASRDSSDQRKEL
ncbi:Ras-related protein Rab-7L1 [Amphibalanus amphitrite]|uniref:Ras-related protein Rab-7L1 n=1 Tax=Amphibalanus amphitrite TaxID=1232801 RepID=A0A6A4VIR1_AMPAM|nr:ras-related protein Rab-7L1-like [Amphibalanus amphitrite]XP_043233993.1 ras-related protein Rab-7L1-like [Amphibalanus amphitrite]KAF0293473.1 Ras-related protein Rab-7L1 [Amphibalanus amphitrite]